MCCSVRDSLIGTLENVLAANPGRFDYVIVETAGVADPERVIGLFWVDADLGSQIHLDGVATVVDAHNIGQSGGMTAGQIALLISCPICSRVIAVVILCINQALYYPQSTAYSIITHVYRQLSRQLFRMMTTFIR